jgi:hypothetical protein
MSQKCEWQGCKNAATHTYVDPHGVSIFCCKDCAVSIKESLAANCRVDVGCSKKYMRMFEFLADVEEALDPLYNPAYQIGDVVKVTLKACDSKVLDKVRDLCLMYECSANFKFTYGTTVVVFNRFRSMLDYQAGLL